MKIVDDDIVMLSTAKHLGLIAHDILAGILTPRVCFAIATYGGHNDI